MLQGRLIFTIVYVKSTSRDQENFYCLEFWTSQSPGPCYFDVGQTMFECHKDAVVIKVSLLRE